MISPKPIIGIIGGSGDLGSGLAKCWAAAGYKVIIGSRSRLKAEERALELSAGVIGEDNVSATSLADIVVLAVPFANHDATIEEIKCVVHGKIVVDAAVPLVPPKVSTVLLPSAGSATQIAQPLNSDLRESYGAWKMGDDAALLGVVSSANVARAFPQAPSPWPGISAASIRKSALAAGS
jgi:NADPH-dependent F420 reductase